MTATARQTPAYTVGECGMAGCQKLARYDNLCVMHLARSRRRWMHDYRDLEARLVDCLAELADARDALRGARR